MPKKRDILTNPCVSEFVYDTIVNSTIDQKKFLNGKFLRVGRTSRTAKAFSVSSGMEERALVLAKLGVPFAWVFNISEKKLKELYDDRHSFNQVKLADKMIEEKMFVITDKEFMQYAGLMASSCHSETWILNRDFLKVHYHLREWRRDYENATNKETKEGIAASKEIAKLITNSIIFSKYSDGTYGINEQEIAVLMYMYSKQKEFIELKQLKIHFNGIYRNFKLVRAINTLLKNQYVEKGVGQFEDNCRITGWGVDIVLKFQKRVFALENY